MKASIQFNTMNELWILFIDCKHEESSKYIRTIIKIIVKILSGTPLPGNKRRIRAGRHYIIHDYVVEVHTDEWFPLVLASKRKDLLEGIKSIFMDMVNEK
ncbi:hypothetical protein [Pedobacter sandarakinus]|uniref:hypothetical protein n=1 Tax=Pedobacter sandarakinus TaxID=353156 RepID=UPI00224777B0|nr:hypothetical protein [Pedobacter sandarakinus]MCX2574318.1 hypothetical protein [Pedobacter sandarakinus]